jgi:hypothetical protein
MSDISSKGSGFGIGELGQVPETDAEATLAAATTQSQPKANDYPNGRKLNCGHTVYDAWQVMSASLGSSCERCFDRMSG